MAELIRLGILGCGMIGRAFADAARQDPRFDVVALHSRRLESMQALAAAAPRAAMFASRAAFLRHNGTDAIVVCTPHGDHARDARDALAAGKHVLLEKPMATSLEQLDRLEDGAARSDRVLLALPHSRYAYIAALRRLASDGFLGKIMAVHSVLDVPGPFRSNWYYSASAQGGASIDTLPYALSRALAVLRLNVSAASGLKARSIARRRCLDGANVSSEVDDIAALTLAFSNGQVAFIRSSWNCWQADDHLLLSGRRGDAKVDCWRKTMIVRCEPPLPLGGQPAEWDGQPAVAFGLPQPQDEYLKLEAFADAVRSGHGNTEEAAYAMRLILSIPPRGGAIDVPLRVYDESAPPKSLVQGCDYV